MCNMQKIVLLSSVLEKKEEIIEIKIKNPSELLINSKSITYLYRENTRRTIIAEAKKIILKQCLPNLLSIWQINLTYKANMYLL